jgi:hypothetical protein
VSVQQILLALAGNPALPAEQVDALVATGDLAVQRVLAREQRLTSAQVDLLAACGDREVLAALIESGNLPVERVPRDDPWALLAGIERADAPGEWLERLGSWPDTAVRQALGEHTLERLDIAQMVADDADCAVAAYAGRLWELPEELAVRQYGRTEACIRIALAASMHAPSQLLAALITTGGSPPMDPCPHWPDASAAMHEMRRAAAGNPASPSAAIEQLTAEPDPATALALAGRADLPGKTFDRLVALQDQAVTMRIAMNWATPADLLRQLYDLDAGRWRAGVLANPRTPLDLLVRHSRADGLPDTGYHPDSEGLRVLAVDPDPRVRLVAAASFRLPTDVRAALIDDPDFDVARRAVCFNAVSAEQVRQSAARHGPRMFPTLAAHPSCPSDVLLTIATHPQSPTEAIIDVAWQEAAPAAALAACLRHPSTTPYVAGNPALPPHMLLELAAHHDPDVVLEVARNPSLTPTAVHHILRSWATPNRMTPQHERGPDNG